MRCVPQLQKTLISVRTLEAQYIRETLGEDNLKILSGTLIALKGIRRNNLYYLKGSVVIKNLAASEQLEDESTSYGI